MNMSSGILGVDLPRGRQAGLPRGGLDPWRGVRRFWGLLWSLTARDVAIRYRQSLLGVLWAVLVPLSMMVVFTLVLGRSGMAIQRSASDAPYALFAYVGLVPWTFFANSLSGCVTSLTANRNLVTKVYFPHEVFPLSAIAAGLVDFVIQSAVLIVLMICFEHTTAWRFDPSLDLLLLPVLVALQILLTSGLGLILAMGNLFFRDVRHIFGVVVQLLLFVSNVVLPLPGGTGWLDSALRLNPVATLMTGYRACLLGEAWPTGAAWGVLVAAAVMSAVVGCRLFRGAAPRFAECI